MQEWFIRQFNYDLWACQRIADVIFSVDHPEIEKQIQFFCHTIVAQEIWLNRVEQKDFHMDTLWPIWTEQEFREKAVLLHHRWVTILPLKNLSQQIAYSTTTGAQFSSSVMEIVQHVVIHGQHHRAQIAAWLSAHGVNVPPTDFIFFSREK